jgi:hypothetical protein
MTSRQFVSNSFIALPPPWAVARPADAGLPLRATSASPLFAGTRRRFQGIGGPWSCLSIDSPTTISAWSRHPESASPDTQGLVRPMPCGDETGLAIFRSRATLRVLQRGARCDEARPGTGPTRGYLVDPRGVEPLTSWLPGRRRALRLPAGTANALVSVHTVSRLARMFRTSCRTFVARRACYHAVTNRSRGLPPTVCSDGPPINRQAGNRYRYVGKRIRSPVAPRASLTNVR